MNTIKKLKEKSEKVKRYFKFGQLFLNSRVYSDAQTKDTLESKKMPSRTEIINFILSLYDRETSYLEIGVRNPALNFDHIRSKIKYSVDPGIEFKDNPVDFPLTSDEFFAQLKSGLILSKDIKFDVIFIDGLHLAEQVDRDILNALDFLKHDGFIVLHDCNPPTEWHARIEHNFRLTPALSSWNGTTWKAFLKWRSNPAVQSCCIDSDWGVGILSKGHPIGHSIEKVNEFYDFNSLEANRLKYLNLIDFKTFQERLLNGKFKS